METEKSDIMHLDLSLKNLFITSFYNFIVYKKRNGGKSDATKTKWLKTPLIQYNI